MAKKTQKIYSSQREVLESFDLKAFEKWLRKNNKVFYLDSYKGKSEEEQMTVMCKTICNRKDMLGTKSYLKALGWLKEHANDGRLF